MAPTSAGPKTRGESSRQIRRQGFSLGSSRHFRKQASDTLEDDLARHWHLASRSTHPQLRPPLLDPTWITARDMYWEQRNQINSTRSSILDDINELVEEIADTTEAWYDQLAPHIKKLYLSPPLQPMGADETWPTEHFSNWPKKTRHKYVQIPVLMLMLKWMNYPGIGDLREDLTFGFEMLGKLHRGTGWKDRTDNRYKFPTSIDSFRKGNLEYIIEKLKRKDKCTHSGLMLQEILEEVDQARFEGPFHAPDSWGTKFVGVPTRPDLPIRTLEDTDVIASFAFPIIQTGSDGSPKVRRGEDWRRSGQNGTVQVEDQPHHHNIDCYVAAAQLWSEVTHAHTPHGWTTGAKQPTELHM